MSTMRLSAIKTLRIQLESIKGSNENLLFHSGIKRGDGVEVILPVLGLTPEDKKEFAQKLQAIQDAIDYLLQYSDEIIKEN